MSIDPKTATLEQLCKYMNIEPTQKAVDCALPPGYVLQLNNDKSWTPWRLRGPKTESYKPTGDYILDKARVAAIAWKAEIERPKTLTEAEFRREYLGEP